jgi:hypothetical protein
VEQPLAELAQIADINAPGGFSPVEAWALHRADVQARRARFDPRVAVRIALGEGVSAADYLRMLQRRRDWIARVEQALQPFDALVCPTVPMVAPPLQPLLADDPAFFRTNGLLLRNTLVANFLDGCAFSLPCQAPGELPVGLMLVAGNGADARLAEVALAAEAALGAGSRGARRVTIRLHVDAPLAAGAELALPEAAARHAQVRRVQPGDTLRLFDGHGHEHEAQVASMGRREVLLRVGAGWPPCPSRPAP